MNIRLPIPLLPLAFATLCVGAEFPRIACLQPGEVVYVSMRLHGYAITGADFLFTPAKVTVKPMKTDPGEIVLTTEEKAKLDEYLVMIRNGEKRPPDQEGFEYLIKFFKNEQLMGTWSFQIYDARDSKKPNLSLYELKDRIEKQQKEHPAPAVGGKRAK